MYNLLKTAITGSNEFCYYQIMTFIETFSSSEVKSFDQFQYVSGRIWEIITDHQNENEWPKHKTRLMQTKIKITI